VAVGANALLEGSVSVSALGISNNFILSSGTQSTISGTNIDRFCGLDVFLNSGP
jgi:hypothetical protein